MTEIMREEHIKAVAQLEKECFSEPWSEKSLLEEIDNPDAYFIVETENGEVVGYAGMHTPCGDCYIDNIAVFEKHRGKGYGERLTLSLIEKAQQNYDEKQAAEMAEKMRNNDFNLEDFLDQMQQIKKMGPLKDLLGMIPGMSQFNLNDVEVNPKDMAHIEAIIQSMTKEERQNPSILNGPRKKRIANGSGRTIAEVNRLLKQFEEMKKMMKQMNMMGKMAKGKKGRFKIPGMFR